MKRFTSSAGNSAPTRASDGAGEKVRRRPYGSEVILPHSQIFEISQDAIFFWRNPGGIEFWNRGAAELYGYSEKEALGRSSHELLQTQFPVPWPEIEEKLITEGSWRGELRHRRRGGQEIIVLSRFQVVPQAGKGMLILESTRDITDAKKNEQRLEHRLREQAVVARFSLDALQATNIQTICDDATHLLAREMNVDFSSLFESLADEKTMVLRSGSGWKPGHVGVTKIEIGEETAIGRTLQLNQPIVIENVREDRHLRLPKFMREHKVTSSMAVVIQGRDRAFGVLGVDTTEHRAFTGEDIHFLEAIGNVLATAISRIQFEHESRDIAARLKDIVDTAVDGIITINERGIVETMNPSAERIFGYAADEVLGRNVSMLMPEPYQSEHDGYLERYRRTGERRIIGIGREVRGRRKDGTEFPMDLAISAINLGDRRIFTGLVRDITARKALEREILEITDQEKRRLGSDLHDDLCQRLASVRFFCDALKKGLSKMQPAEARKQLEKIGADVSESIDRTRMLARGLAPVALETNGLVSALKELTGNIAKVFKVKCSFREKGEIVVKDSSAATQLFRITQEAINNALKHAHAKQIVVSLEKAGGKNVLTIADNGVGFSLEESQHGTEGMGLRTIAYRAGMIGADVEVRSAVNDGTKIIVTFRTDL
jgi:two-component system, LuxR family, sensor kinase FixL